MMKYLFVLLVIAQIAFGQFSGTLGSPMGFGNGLGGGAGFTTISSGTPVVPFSPADSAGLIRWYKADAVGNLWKDVARTSAVTANGDTVKNWDDTTANLVHVYSYTDDAALSPTWVDSAKNSLGALSFDGTNDNLIVLTPMGTVTPTIFFVAYIDSGETFQDVLIQFDVSAGDAIAFYNNANILLAAPFSNQQAVLSTMKAWALHSVKVSGDANSNYRINGVSKKTWNSVGLSDFRFYIGANSVSGAGALKFKVGEIIVYDHAMTAAGITSVETYLNTKWAVY